MPTNSRELIDIYPIKAFSDNYIWAISHHQNNKLTLVDPGDASVCIDYIEQHQLQLDTILITHHHSDHIGGVVQLRHYCQDKGWTITIYGPAKEAIDLSDIQLSDGQHIHIDSLGVDFTVLEVPGHTLGHIAYYADNTLFCGDTLFSGGCGRIFEGTAEQMFTSLNRLASLSGDTKVYCTHEYTLANLTFALAVEPDNVELIDYYNHVKNRLDNGDISLPSTIEQERKINPFLRCQQHTIQESAMEYASIEKINTLTTFATIREWKNNA
ncbi:hydroxyacylglutathione hydrolase [Thalassotalea ganghwensis]